MWAWKKKENKFLFYSEYIDDKIDYHGNHLVFEYMSYGEGWKQSNVWWRHTSTSVNGTEYSQVKKKKKYEANG